MKIHGANILITGGAGAFGKSFAFDLATRGGRVFVCDDNTEALTKTKEEAQEKSIPIQVFKADVSRESDVEALFREVVDQFGKVDVLINNAGIAEDGLLIKKEGEVLKKFPLERWQRGLAVNLTGVFLCGREAAFQMIRQGRGGVIINISSISRHGNFIQSNYSATKAAIVALTVVWAKELSKYKIRTASLAPGYVDTPLLRNIPSEIRSRVVSSEIPLGRTAEVEEISHAVRFIIENDYLNGRVIDIDGGLRF